MIDRFLTTVVVAVVLCGSGVAAFADRPSPLTLEATIALPHTSGRIDHLGVDLTRKRLFVAELGNGSVDVVDLGSRSVVHRISGLNEPQGVVYEPKSDLLVVASGGDGTVRVFSANDFSPRGMIKLGSDADNVRLDARSGNVVAGYGGGGLAIVDPARAVNLEDIALPGHPEGFQLSASDGLAYVNVPDAHQIAVVDLGAGKLIAGWTVPHLTENFPMALGDGGTIAVAFRSTPRLVRFDRASGRAITTNDTCGDADDVFFDAERQRYYVSCGAGAIDVFQMTGGAVHPLARVATASGARTSLFVPELDRLFLAVRAGWFGSDAAIQIFRPAL